MSTLRYTTIADVRHDGQLSQKCLEVAASVACGRGLDAGGDAQDVADAIRELLFEEVVAPLLEELERHRKRFPLYQVLTPGVEHIESDWTEHWLPLHEAVELELSDEPGVMGDWLILENGKRECHAFFDENQRYRESIDAAFAEARSRLGLVTKKPQE